jgi:hypothetical protein
MKTVTFDTLEFAKKLKSAKFTEEQSEVLAQAVASVIDEQIATKRDLQEMELRLKHDLTLRLGAMLVAGITIVAALVKLL